MYRFYVHASEEPPCIYMRAVGSSSKSSGQTFHLEGLCSDGICFFMEKDFKRKNVIEMIMKIFFIMS